MTSPILRVFFAAALATGFVACKKSANKAEPAKAEPAKPEPKPEPKPEAAPVPAPVGKAAAATLESKSGSTVTGMITLSPTADGKVAIVVAATGLTPGEHGFHIHETGDCSAPDAKSAGGHFNPDQVDHGSPAAMPHHAGDFGNLTAGPDGKVDQTVTIDYVTLDDGPRSAIGRAFVLHEKADDLKTQPTGDAGGRVACGVIAAK